MLRYMLGVRRKRRRWFGHVKTEHMILVRMVEEMEVEGCWAPVRPSKT